MAKADTQTLREEARTEARTVARTARDGAERVAHEAAETAELTYEQLREQVDMLRADLARLTGTAHDAGAEVAGAAAQSVRRVGRTAAAAVGEGYEHAEAQVEDVLTRAGDYTRANPATALGLAAGAGFLLALVLARR